MLPSLDFPMNRVWISVFLSESLYRLCPSNPAITFSGHIKGKNVSTPGWHCGLGIRHKWFRVMLHWLTGIPQTGPFTSVIQYHNVQNEPVNTLSCFFGLFLTRSSPASLEALSRKRPLRGLPLHRRHCCCGLRGGGRGDDFLLNLGNLLSCFTSQGVCWGNNTPAGDRSAVSIPQALPKSFLKWMTQPAALQLRA